MSKKYQYELEIFITTNGFRQGIYNLVSDLNCINLVVTYAESHEKRMAMKKVCEVLNISCYNFENLPEYILFDLHRVDNDPPKVIPIELSSEILDLS